MTKEKRITILFTFKGRNKRKRRRNV